MNDQLRKHLFDLIKGALGAAIAAFFIAFAQYLGHEIPAAMQAAVMGVTSFGAVKINTA